MFAKWRHRPCEIKSLSKSKGKRRVLHIASRTRKKSDKTLQVAEGDEKTKNSESKPETAHLWTSWQDFIKIVQMFWRTVHGLLVRLMLVNSARSKTSSGAVVLCQNCTPLGRCAMNVSRSVGSGLSISRCRRYWQPPSLAAAELKLMFFLCPPHPKSYKQQHSPIGQDDITSQTK